MGIAKALGSYGVDFQAFPRKLCWRISVSDVPCIVAATFAESLYASVYVYTKQLHGYTH